MKELASIHPHSPHILHIVDDYSLEGPDGTHRCLVFELLGPSVPDTIETRFSDGRLPGKLQDHCKTGSFWSWSSTPRVNGHGGESSVRVSFKEFWNSSHLAIDLLTRNLAFTARHNVPDKEFIETSGKPGFGHVHRSDGKALEPGVPE